MAASPITHIGVVNQPFTKEDIARIRERKDRIEAENKAAQKEFQMVQKLVGDQQYKANVNQSRLTVLANRRTDIDAEISKLTGKPNLSAAQIARFDELNKEVARIEAEVRIIEPEIAKAQSVISSLALRIREATNNKNLYDAIMEGST
jgi:chromosome segregation ATPase